MASNAIRIDLGDMAGNAERIQRIRGYDSIDEVIQEGLRALDREQQAIDARHRELIQEALDDPRPPIPLEEAFAEIRRRSAALRQA